MIRFPVCMAAWLALAPALADSFPRTQGAPSAVLAQSLPARIIVRFVDGVAAADPALIQTLSAQLALPLVYERAMSGQAHLYRIEGSASAEQLRRAVEVLRARPDVIYAEEDRVAQPVS